MDTNKKILDSRCPEFGLELIQVIPLAYYLHTQGELEKVIVSKDMSWFYYFTNCEEIYDVRLHLGGPIDAESKEGLSRMGTPYAWKIPSGKKYPDAWLPPPYKEYYGGNDIFKFNRPLCIISNKYSKEFGGLDPVNYFRLDVLRKMIEYLKNKYTVVYNRMTPNEGTLDPGQPILDFGDFDLIKEYKEVILIQDLMKKFNMTYNEVIAKLYSKCDKFISVHGGPCILSSYFGGTNIIFTIWGLELSWRLKFKFRYDTFPHYHLFSGCEIIVVQNEYQLMNLIKMKY